MVNRSEFDIYLKTVRGDLKPKSYNGIVYLIHEEDFSIVLENNSFSKVKARITVSGEDIGTLVLQAGQIVEVKRPIEGVDRKFKFAAFGSKISKEGGLNENKLHSDEVTVIFYPNHEQNNESYTKPPRGISVETDGISNRGGGILGPEQSFQNFFEVRDFKTKGEFYFTIIMRRVSFSQKKTPPSIIPIRDMKKYF